MTTPFRSPDGRWEWNGVSWVPAKRSHPVLSVTLIALGILVILAGGLGVVVGFAGLLLAPAIQGGAFGFFVLFALMFVAAGVASLVAGIKLS